MIDKSWHSTWKRSEYRDREDIFLGRICPNRLYFLRKGLAKRTCADRVSDDKASKTKSRKDKMNKQTKGQKYKVSIRKGVELTKWQKAKNVPTTEYVLLSV